MENKSDYEVIVEEYRQVCHEYEAAAARMVAMAARPECEPGDFKDVAERVTRLAEKLSTLRSAMKLTYGRASTEREPPLPC